MSASWEIRQGDCIDSMRAMADCSVDAIVCDPPYGLEFMGKDWDRPWAMGKVTDTGEADGTPFRRNAGTPSWAAAGNPICRNCGGTKYDRTRPTGCVCDAPSFPNEAVAQMRAFQAWCEAWAAEALRVLKPGGHLLAFGGTRTYHRLAAGVEDAGFEVRDTVAWMYGSGFPKSMDVSKAIDKAARGVPHGGSDPTSPNHGRFRTSATEGKRGDGDKGQGFGAGPGQFMQSEEDECDPTITASARTTVPSTPSTRDPDAAAADAPLKSTPAATASLTPDAEQWAGWGTALKPAFEPIVVARKPLAGTVAANVLEHGAGGLNIDGCRIATDDDTARHTLHTMRGGNYEAHTPSERIESGGNTDGRWPANVVLDPGAAALLDEQTGELRSGGGERQGPADGGNHGGFSGVTPTRVFDASAGGASRFFYCAKASRAERNAGLDDFPARERTDESAWIGCCAACGKQQSKGERGASSECCGAPTEWKTPTATRNIHPTVKPIELMRWLVRLVTPPGGLVLDPFAGSGTTGCAAVLEGFDFIGLEREPEYVEIARARIGYWADPEKARLALAEAERERERQEADESGAEVQLDLLGEVA